MRLTLADDYRTPLTCESQSYELTGLVGQAGQIRFSLDHIRAATGAASEIPYEATATHAVLQKRLIEHEKIFYRRNDLSAAMAPGHIESLALPFETYRLAFTPGLVSHVYGARVTDSMLANDGGYVHSDGDSNWWIPSGRQFYSPRSEDSAIEELAHARSHFFLPHRNHDPFHSAQFNTETVTTYDRYSLMLEQSRDALGNTFTVGRARHSRTHNRHGS